MYGRTDVREITEVSGRTGEWGNGEGRETTEGRERTERRGKTEVWGRTNEWGKEEGLETTEGGRREW